MSSMLHEAGLRLVEASKRRLKSAVWLRRMPGVRYTYLFDMARGIVVPELQLCFVPTPKVANRSIKAALAAAVWPGYRGDPHRAGWQYRPVAALHKTGFFRFGFVRNPLDRLYSCYAQKIVFYGRMRGMPVELWRYGNVFHPDMTFADFVEAVVNIPDRIADRHFRSQHTFLCYKGEPVVDFIGRFERLEQDWSAIRDRFGLPPLGHHNRSPHPHFSRAYTPELARAVARRYARDIELFGYGDDPAGVLAGDCVDGPGGGRRAAARIKQ